MAITAPDGKTYKSFEKMCEAYDLKMTTVKARLKRGWDLASALMPISEPEKAHDHLGNEYESFTAMCKHYNQNSECVKERLKSGMSLEIALTKKTRNEINKGQTYIDHLGNEFATFAEMCKYHNRPSTSVRCALKNNIDLETALTTKGVDHTCEDHQGNIFPSFAKMCEYYDVRVQTVLSRLKRGKSLEDALLGTNSKRLCQDHLGNTYRSFNAMCKKYGINSVTAHSRIYEGWTLEDALTIPSGQKPNSDVYKDHLGNTYKSFEAMCCAYGMNAMSVRGRIASGKTLEEALTEETKPTSKIIEQDPFGRSFPSRKAMTNFYMLSPQQLYRTENPTAKDICDSLRRKKITMNGHVFKILDTNAPYVETEIDGKEYIIRFECLMEIYHNSDAFDPYEGLGHAKNEIKSIHLVKFPYYDIVTTNGESKQISYWDLIRDETERMCR